MKTRKTKIVYQKFFLGLVVGLLLGAALILFWPKKAQTQIQIKNKKINVQVVATDEERQKGLGGRKFLAEDEGMLFVFDEADYYVFWMKDMLIPIDIIYLKNNKIIEIAKDMQAAKPAEEPSVYQPSCQADMVLEVNAGLADELSWEIGDFITIKNYKI